MSALVTQPQRMTVDQYLQLPEDNRKCELIDGEVYMSPSPGNFHQRISSNLELALGIYLASNPIGLLYHAPFDVFLEGATILQPDVLFVAEENFAKFDERGIHGAPDLVVEILSPGTSQRDLQEKRALYQAAQVKEMWFVSPVSRTVEVERLTKEFVYAPPQLFADDDTLTSDLLPGFAMTLREVFKSPLRFQQPN